MGLVRPGGQTVSCHSADHPVLHLSAARRDLFQGWPDGWGDCHYDLRHSADGSDDGAWPQEGLARDRRGRENVRLDPVADVDQGLHPLGPDRDPCGCQPGDHVMSGDGGSDRIYRHARSGRQTSGDDEQLQTGSVVRDRGHHRAGCGDAGPVFQSLGGETARASRAWHILVCATQVSGGRCRRLYGLSYYCSIHWYPE
ncbi:hypothetical protein ROA7745_00002 [Roseovarius aestuarii]|uniref:Uncharacterized protein n=1 Tax=Roseovarius aestuarii TaxID=475083 RepID=A0A1X7BKU8_9RHOB|nr:hypothetical protein ROA7745_00002 [Roseovarius aestuarii]